MSELSFDGALALEDIIHRSSRDRDDLTAEIVDLYPRLEGRIPAELVADIIFDICDWGIGRRNLQPKQLAYCDFSTRRIFLNANLSGIASKKNLDPIAFRRTVLAHELGHIRLHGSEMENRDFRSYLGPDKGYDDSRSVQRENEAEVYAAIFLVPWDALQSTEQAFRLGEAAKNLQQMSGENRNLSGRLDDINRELASVFGVTPNLMSRSLEAYDLVERTPTRKSEVFRLSLKRQA